MNRLTITAAIAAVLLFGTACSPAPDSGDNSAQQTALFEAAAVKESCGDGGIIAMMNSVRATEPIANQILCGDMKRGEQLAVLSQPDRLVWDRNCVQEGGYALTTGQDGVERLTSQSENYDPQEVAQCATPKFTAEQCTTIQTGLGAIDSGPDVRGIVMAKEEAAVLHQLGCPVPPVVRPSK